ncbi:hypothetical protein J8273_1485 [Carpediemonas membranifera]|uniref:Uncharacterized protein n=1 Tax=Carpediemonas membranifera TaxID=201153 RepID=A0A8J6B663_9EUKA|nr:hypothetical protein J8273_1485 [Carpediemonas membranifera]|eukprot:KAG9396498.1 hypothetical protein J8273_1485 [Carpediemonas membranifera]
MVENSEHPDPTATRLNNLEASIATISQQLAKLNPPPPPPETEPPKESQIDFFPEQDEADIDQTLAEMDAYGELPTKRPLKAEAKWLRRVMVIVNALDDEPLKARLLVELQARRTLLDLKDDNWSDATCELFLDLFNTSQTKPPRAISYCAAKARAKGKRKDQPQNKGGFTRSTRSSPCHRCSVPVNEQKSGRCGQDSVPPPR